LDVKSTVVILGIPNGEAGCSVPGSQQLTVSICNNVEDTISGVVGLIRIQNSRVVHLLVVWANIKEAIVVGGDQCGNGHVGGSAADGKPGGEEQQSDHIHQVLNLTLNLRSRHETHTTARGMTFNGDSCISVIGGDRQF
jgi:hypothetical protein